LWAVLLPVSKTRFRHMVVLGGPPDLVEQLRAARYAATVSESLPADGLADAVVRLPGTEASLERVLDALEPGGVFYGEFPRLVRSGNPVSALRRTLSRRNMTDVDMYWTMGNQGSTHTFVPLGSPNALRWYLANIHRAAGPGQFLSRLLIRILSFGGERFYGYGLRSLAVTGVLGGGSARGKFVFSDEPSPLQHELRGERPRLLLLGSRNERTVVAVFRARDRYPTAFLKISNAPWFDDMAVRKQRILSAMHERLGDPIFSHIPRPLGHTWWRGRAVSVESGVRGDVLLAPRWGRRRASRRNLRDFQRVVSWLTSLHQATTSAQGPWSDHAASQSWLELSAGFARHFGAHPEVGQLLDQARLRSLELADLPIPTVWAHGDFHTGNILRCSTAIGAVDWIDSGPGLPLMDLLKFVENWNAHVTRSWAPHERSQQFRELFLSSTTRELGGMIRTALTGYADTMQMDRRFISLFLVHLWTELSVRHASLAESGASAAHRRYASVFSAHVLSMAADPVAALRDW
jgi:hypothetical protein